MFFFTTIALSLFITLALVPILRGLAFRLNAVDMPNPRKVHSQPMPKVGGIAMALGVLVPLLVWAPREPLSLSILIGAGIIFVFGLADDLRDLSYRYKFAGQIIAALVVVFVGGLQISSLGDWLPEGTSIPPEIGIVLTIIAIVGVTNAINLADGLDGLAGGIMLLSYLCIAFVAYKCQNPIVLLVSGAMIGAIFGFLRFNTHPATVFMGDTGSQMLGFLAITLCLALTQPQKVLSPLFPLILLGFPVLDTLTVMTGRIMRGVSPFKADKNHFHHKLMRQGLYHSEAVFVIYAIQSLAVLLAYVLRFESDIAILIVYAAASFLLIAATTAAGRRHWKRPRLDLIDRVVKGRLKQWRDRQVAIKIVYRMVRYGLPLLLLTSCLIPTRLPDYFGLLVSAFATVVVLVCRYAPRYSGNTARAVLYLTIPLMVFEAQKAEAEFVDTAFVTLYHAGFGIIAAAVVLTLRLTRRQNGFKATPMDFIVLFVAVVLPNLPGTEMVSEDLGNLTAKIVILLFGYEVLIGECRNELRFVGLSTVAILAVAAIKALVM